MIDYIRLELPTSSRYTSTVRITAAGIAAELDFDVDAIEEFRMGVNELVALVIDSARAHDAARVHVDFLIEEHAIEVICGFDSARADCVIEVDELAEQILDAVADEHRAEGTTMRLLKRRINERV